MTAGSLSLLGHDACIVFPELDVVLTLSASQGLPIDSKPFAPLCEETLLAMAQESGGRCGGTARWIETCSSLCRPSAHGNHCHLLILDWDGS